MHRGDKRNKVDPINVFRKKFPVSRKTYSTLLLFVIVCVTPYCDKGFVDHKKLLTKRSAMVMSIFLYGKYRVRLPESKNCLLPNQHEVGTTHVLDRNQDVGKTFS